MTSPIHEPRTFSHCSAGAIECPGCMTALAAEVAFAVDYNFSMATDMGLSWYGSWIPGGPHAPYVLPMALRSATLALCRTNDITESDFHATSGLRIQLVPDAPAVARYRWLHDFLAHPLRTMGRVFGGGL